MRTVLSRARARLRRLVPLLLAFGLVSGAAVATQVAASTQAFAGTDTYPSQWKNIPQDSVFDTWGEYNRECTSYVSWMLHSANGYEIPFHGNASTWVTKASAIPGVVINTTPAPGAVGWMSIGHVAWIESVNSNGTVNAEDYNYSYDGTYAEHLNQAASTYQKYIHFKDIPVWTSSYQSFAGDFNGDGQVDIALRNIYTGTFYVRYGPTFGSQDTFTWDNSVSDYQAFVGDFNGDHNVDVGLRNPHTGLFLIRYGPSFTAQDTFQWDNSVSDYQAFVGDFNGDGHADVALRDPHSGTFYIRYGPSFTTQTAFQWDHSISDYQAFVGDFNGDGQVDVALRNPHSGIFYVRYGPSFTAQDTFQWDNSVSDYQAFVGDFNGDHNVDVGLRNPHSGIFDIRYGPSLTGQTAYQWDVG